MWRARNGSRHLKQARVSRAYVRRVISSAGSTPAAGSVCTGRSRARIAAGQMRASKTSRGGKGTLERMVTLMFEDGELQRLKDS